MTITFYATMSSDHVRRKYWDWMHNVPTLLPASSWSRPEWKFRLKPVPMNPAIDDVAADCGGFVATFKRGGYTYTSDEYVTWLDQLPKLTWAATMDYCCEEEITGKNDGVVRERQQRTSEMAYHFWSTYNHLPWAWVPTVQGWTVADYVRHARELRPLIQEMQRASGPAFRVGIGTLCRRASAAMVAQVVKAVAFELPGVPLHLWGVKLTALQSRHPLYQVVSVDSAAWDQGGMGRDGIRQLHEQRAQGMTQREYSHKIALPRYLAKV